MTSAQKIKNIAAWLLPSGTGIRKKLFFCIDILLLTLILIFGAAMFQNYHSTGSESENAYAGFAEQFKNQTAKPDPRSSKVDDYRIIWERNLFNTSGEANPVSKDEFADAKIVLAKKDMGLELIGTVVGENPDLNRAFIFNHKNGSQEIYALGDRVDMGLIKKILHSEVVMSTENSDELLVFRVGDFPELSGTSKYAHLKSINNESLQQATPWNSPRNRKGSVALTRKEVEASLADMNKKAEQFEISTFIKGKQPMGFRVGNIIPDSIFDKMGLRYGEAITAVNDESIAGPDEFFQQLKKGGSVTIKVQKRRRRQTPFSTHSSEHQLISQPVREKENF